MGFGGRPGGRHPQGGHGGAISEIYGPKRPWGRHFGNLWPKTGMGVPFLKSVVQNGHGGAILGIYGPKRAWGRRFWNLWPETAMEAPFLESMVKKWQP